MTTRIVLAVTFGVYFVLSGTRPLMSLYASSLGADTFDIGLLAAAYAFCPLLLAMHMGRLSDVIGDRLPAALGAAGIAAGLLIPFLVHTIGALYLSQVVVGVSQMLCMVSVQNVIGKTSTEATRDHRFAIFTMSASIGNLLGPISGGYMAEAYSYTAAFLAAGAIGVAPALLALLLPAIKGRAKRARTKPESSTLSLLRVPALRRAMTTSALVLYSRDIFVVYFPLFAIEAGLSGSTIGWIISIQALTQIIVRFFLGRLTGMFGRQTILIGSILLAGAAFVLIPLTGDPVHLGLLSALMGLGLGCGQPLSISTTYSASPESRTGEVLGLRLAVNRLSQLIAPLFFGVIGTWVGLLSVFYVSGTFLIGGAFLARRKRHPESPRDLCRPADPLEEPKR